ncbi:5'-methylthioadenosine/adenosylhomocysteine nucleosidase [Shimazuella sp. AN120528]|uniref:5'-methylthioadenosine/adenosylhomocysteine nucleosidase n=1 Tax=Shimazuella soli TaxID=1892854 RepID=UPI001F0EB027|nr:5'-methylthioadenosine/adenosylhomocysteine nucleosidase [Shimazuella soli]MCH5583547.1 5'-methylthioadenosine/adenosylhomocysteine nucleosidase [Shimazuella soli]
MIGIIGAMDVEIEQLLLNMERTKSEERFGNNFITGVLADVPVVITKSGVGKVNASISAFSLIRDYNVSAIVFIGVAGALHPELNIGDMIVSTSCQEHDIDASSLGFPRGTIPYQSVSEYQADPDLVQTALKAATELESLESINVRSGKVLSGDQFISDRSIVKFLHQELGGDCVEMEGAAVAHVCYQTSTPFVVIRSMSDRADNEAPVDFVKFTELAAIRSCNLVTSMLHLLREDRVV